MQATAQTWPDYYLTNGTHNTSYGVETYDPTTAKNLYINPAAILQAGGTKLDSIYDGNQVYLNGGTVHASAIDEPDFTWNSGTLNLNGGTHLTTYGLNIGAGKILNIGAGAKLRQETLTSLPVGNQLYLRQGGWLSVGNFNPMAIGFDMYSHLGEGTIEVTGTLSQMPTSFDSNLSLILNGSSAQWILETDELELVNGSVTVKNGGTLKAGVEDWDDSSVTITGSGSTWDTGFLNMNGNQGELTISDGGQVLSANAHIGNVPGEGNKVVVTGNGSLWNSGDIYMGQSLAGENSLVVSNGAQVLSGGALIGVPRTGGNDVIVYGSNSQWKMSGGITLGEGSGGNMLTITDGGYVESALAYIGKASGSWRSLGNRASVSGEGSFWNNTGQITIGSTASDEYGNGLDIGSGGKVFAGGGVVLNGTQNSLNLNNGGRLEIGTDFNASMAGFNFNASSAESVGSMLPFYAPNP